LRGIAVVALTLALVAAAAGCGDDRPSLDLDEGTNVVLVGDSILHQSTEEVRFVLAGAGLRPFVHGVPGAAVEGAPLVNWHDVVTQLGARHDPEALVIELGTNGCGFCPSMREAIDAVMEAARDVPNVLWIDARSDGPVPDDPDAVNEAIRDAADRWDNLTVVDFDELVSEADISWDEVHLSDKGQVQFAESLAAVLT
jgi:thiol-disulfide isomerase/thioredoxin